jgi:hypothetical protein
MVSGEISLTKQRPRDARGLGVRLRGFEPPTPGSGIQCSIQLSYRRLGQETSADFSEALQRRYYRTKPGRKSSWRLRPVPEKQSRDGWGANWVICPGPTKRPVPFLFHPFPPE